MPMTFSIEGLLRYMVGLRPEPLDPATAADLHGWRLAALRRTLIALERNGIIYFEDKDRWMVYARFVDADAATCAARNAGFDVHELHG
jgi:hypothetical protein